MTFIFKVFRKIFLRGQVFRGTNKFEKILTFMMKKLGMDGHGRWVDARGTVSKILERYGNGRWTVR